MKRKAVVLILSLALIIGTVGCGGNSAGTGVEKPENAPVSFEELNLKIGSAPGPVTYPLATMSEKNPNIILNPWQSGEQLTAMITSRKLISVVRR